MKRFLSRYGICIFTAMLLAGCAAPQVMLFNVDVMEKKAFVLQLDNQSASVVATYDQEKGDSSIMADLARSVADRLEKQNALEEGSVGAFTIPASEYKGSQDKEYLEQLMLATASQSLVIINGFSLRDYHLKKSWDPDRTVPALQTMLTILGKADMEVYDAISDTTLYHKMVFDSVTFRIPTDNSYTDQSLKELISSNDTLVIASFAATLADHICNTWTEEEWMLIDYPNQETWHEAYKNAMDFKWEEAIRGWLPWTENKKPEVASFASFNIAVACQILGQSDLAESWVEYGRQKYDFQEARALRDYIRSKKLQQF